ncbi:MAG: hypothetical protein ACFFG0_39345 [Candidatus Thorarchaeota archaeon]
MSIVTYQGYQRRRVITPYQEFHEKNLGALIFPFLFQNERNNLGLVDRTWQRAKIIFEIQGYQILKNRILSHEAIYITNGSVMYQEILLRIIGCGGSKKAIELCNGRALMLPSMYVDPMYNIVMRWKRMVREEVIMSQLLTKIGILSPLSKRVMISLSQDSHEGTIPAYLSETFENLGKTRGWFIIDTKIKTASTWIKGENFLFSSEEDRLNEQKWDSLLYPLLVDLVKICIYDIPVSKDSLNIAIVKKISELIISRYEIRYFGFDFSNKSVSLAIPSMEKRPYEASDISKATHFFDFILNEVFFYEFNCRYDSGVEREELHHFKDKIVKRNCENFPAIFEIESRQ